MKIIKIIGIVLAISISNISTAAYDGRGDESCSELRKAVKEARNKYKRLKKHSRAEGGDEEKERVSDGWSFSETLKWYDEFCGNRSGNRNYMAIKYCERAEEMRDILESAKEDIADAREDYSLNGCSTGGKTNYNHNYEN